MRATVWGFLGARGRGHHEPNRQRSPSRWPNSCPGQNRSCWPTWNPAWPPWRSTWGLRQGGLTRLLNQPAESLGPKIIEAQLEEHKTGIAC